MAGDFFIDFLSTFYFYEVSILLQLDKVMGPIVWQQLVLLLKLFKLLKVLRLRKIGGLIRGANATIETKAVM